MTDRRATDRRGFGAWWGRWGRDVTTVTAVGLAAWSVITTQNAVGRIEDERVERSSQACVIFERKQAADVRQLEQTYDYLNGLTRTQLQEPLNRAVLAQLGQVEAQAREDDAPPYCDEPNVGLPEPDPVVPRRPPRLAKP